MDKWYENKGSITDKWTVIIATSLLIAGGGIAMLF